MNLQSNQTDVKLPNVNKDAKPKKKRGKQKSRVFYREDFAGLWVFVEHGGERQLLTPYAITDPGYRAAIKTIIDLMICN